MRIGILAPPALPVPPPAYGGTEAVLDTLARGLQRAGHDVLLVTTGDSTCPVDRSSILERAVGVGLGGSGVELRHVVHGYEAAASFGAEIVHDHTFLGPLYALRIPAPPVVTTNHGPFSVKEVGSYYAAIAQRVPIIAISHHHAATAAPTPIAAVIHHAVDVERFPIGEGAGGYALFLGRMHPDKGVATAARVARAAGVPLVIAAKMHEPHEVAYFEAEVQPLLGHGVEYIGEVGGGEKLRVLADAGCLLNPVRWPEPFGMVMIEALACGTPVVATPFGSAPELVQHGVTGYLARSEADLAEYVSRTAALDRRVCRRVAETRFSTERLVAEHEALYQQVVSGERTPAMT